VALLAATRRVTRLEPVPVSPSSVRPALLLDPPRGAYSICSSRPALCEHQFRACSADDLAAITLEDAEELTKLEAAKQVASARH